MRYFPSLSVATLAVLAVSNAQTYGGFGRRAIAQFIFQKQIQPTHFWMSFASMTRGNGPNPKSTLVRA